MSHLKRLLVRKALPQTITIYIEYRVKFPTALTDLHKTKQEIHSVKWQGAGMTPHPALIIELNDDVNKRGR